MAGDLTAIVVGASEEESAHVQSCLSDWECVMAALNEEETAVSSIPPAARLMIVYARKQQKDTLAICEQLVRSVWDQCGLPPRRKAWINVWRVLGRSLRLGSERPSARTSTDACARGTMPRTGRWLPASSWTGSSAITAASPKRTRLSREYQNTTGSVYRNQLNTLF